MNKILQVDFFNSYISSVQFMVKNWLIILTCFFLDSTNHNMDLC